jgi:hypothetical protein
MHAQQDQDVKQGIVLLVVRLLMTVLADKPVRVDNVAASAVATICALKVKCVNKVSAQLVAVSIPIVALKQPVLMDSVLIHALRPTLHAEPMLSAGYLNTDQSAFAPTDFSVNLARNVSKSSATSTPTVAQYKCVSKVAVKIHVCNRMLVVSTHNVNRLTEEQNVAVLQITPATLH